MNGSRANFPGLRFRVTHENAEETPDTGSFRGEEPGNDGVQPMTLTARRQYNHGLSCSSQDPSMSQRQASVERNTNETRIKVSVNLDGTGKFSMKSGLPFLEHMLEQVARHGLIDMEIVADGDLQIDAHHTVEDLGITLGQAVDKALKKTGIRRYGHAYVPLDEALSRVVIDFSGRPGLEYHIPFKRGTVGEFDVDLFFEFFQGFVNHAKVTLHIDNLRGNNAHHQIETVFKAFGRAVRMAIELDPRIEGSVPSTKGTLSD
jgi:imidazoleglycerol-phosphate dehydratase